MTPIVKQSRFIETHLQLCNWIDQYNAYIHTQAATQDSTTSTGGRLSWGLWHCLLGVLYYRPIPNLPVQSTCGRVESPVC